VDKFYRDPGIHLDQLKQSIFYGKCKSLIEPNRGVYICENNIGLTPKRRSLSPAVDEFIDEIRGHQTDIQMNNFFGHLFGTNRSGT
jgi:hypothetical protein